MIRFCAVLRRSLRATAELTILLAFFGLLASKAYAIPLGDRIAEGEPQGITAGNLVFSEWNLISNDSETDLSQIDVTAVVGQPLGSGLRFTDTGGVLVAEIPDDDVGIPVGPPVLANTTASVTLIMIQLRS